MKRYTKRRFGHVDSLLSGGGDVTFDRLFFTNSSVYLNNNNCLCGGKISHPLSCSCGVFLPLWFFFGFVVFNLFFVCIAKSYEHV